MSDGRVVDVFSRADLPDDQDGAVFVNALTGTGVPGGAVPVPTHTGAALPGLGFRLFIVSAILFTLAGVWAYGVGVGSRVTAAAFEERINLQGLQDGFGRRNHSIGYSSRADRLARRGAEGFANK